MEKSHVGAFVDHVLSFSLSVAGEKNNNCTRFGMTTRDAVPFPEPVLGEAPTDMDVDTAFFPPWFWTLLVISALSAHGWYWPPQRERERFRGHFCLATTFWLVIQVFVRSYIVSHWWNMPLPVSIVLLLVSYSANWFKIHVDYVVQNHSIETARNATQATRQPSTTTATVRARSKPVPTNHTMPTDKTSTPPPHATNNGPESSRQEENRTTVTALEDTKDQVSPPWMLVQADKATDATSSNSSETTPAWMVPPPDKTKTMTTSSHDQPPRRSLRDSARSRRDD